MAMVMPRSFSSGALSIWSKGVKSASPLSARTLVMAAVSVVLPWSMCPIVPMFTWGLVRSNFFFDMCSSSPGTSPGLLSSHARDDLARQSLRHLLIRVQLHGRVRCAALRPRPELGGVPEQLGQRHDDTDGLLTGTVVDPLDPSSPSGDVAHHLAHEVLRRDDLELHHRLEEHRVGPLRGLLQRHRTCDLERDLARVDLVVRAVDQRGPDVDERIAGEHAALGGLLDALVHRRDVLARDLPPHDLVDELVAAAGPRRLEVDDRVAVLTAAAGLADEPRLDLVHR